MEIKNLKSSLDCIYGHGVFPYLLWSVVGGNYDSHWSDRGASSLVLGYEGVVVGPVFEVGAQALVLLAEVV